MTDDKPTRLPRREIPSTDMMSDLTLEEYNLIHRVPARKRRVKTMTELPKEIVDLIYRASCCVDSPQQAANEPCACVAAHIVEQIEEWAEDLD